MKNIICILFYLLFISVYPCKPLITDYLKTSGVAENSKKLELYSDSVQNFDSNLIFKLGDKLYIYGEEFLTVNEKTYKYLGNGYYKNKGTVYFFRNKVTKVHEKDKIKTYVKTKEVEKFKGTSCDGQFHEYFFFLEINNIKYVNGNKKTDFITFVIFQNVAHIFDKFTTNLYYKVKKN